MVGTLLFSSAPSGTEGEPIAAQIAPSTHSQHSAPYLKESMMYSKETGMQVTEFTSSVAGLARLCMPAGKMLSIARDRWLFDHMSWSTTYAFSVLHSGHSPGIL